VNYGALAGEAIRHLPPPLDFGRKEIRIEERNEIYRT
jgi:hypothetical protein